MKSPPNQMGVILTVFLGIIFTNGIFIIQGLLSMILTQESVKFDLQFSYFMLTVFGSLTLVCAFVGFSLEEVKSTTRLSF
jgi:uncharacterized membrane protein YeaQ/YmgE (transglycosylase-associated protein family)